MCDMPNQNDVTLKLIDEMRILEKQNVYREVLLKLHSLEIDAQDTQSILSRFSEWLEERAAKA